MVCSPEQARLNGAKSKGAVTDKGKAIASRNATKHGLLATQPPLLASEDLETFQGIVQGLIDQYAPQASIEHLLIQQIAMGWQRLHRVWGVEAAIANVEMLKQQYRNKVPSLTKEPLFPTEAVDDPLAVLEQERDVLQETHNRIEDDFLAEIPKRGFQTWCESKEAATLLKKVNTFLVEMRQNFPPERVPLLAERRRGLHREHIWYQMVIWDVQSRDRKSARCVFRYNLREWHKACAERIEEINQTLADLHQLGEATKVAIAASKAIPLDVERLSRYERHIWKLIQDSLERLNTIQDQRKNEESMGSFGHAPDSESTEDN
jgi:hypothetical protein